MRDIINATLGSDHFLKCQTYTIARNGEGLTPCLSVSIPENLTKYWAYIDFKKPNGETFKTPRIDVIEGIIKYNIPGAVLDADGKLLLQIVFQNEKNEIWKSYVKEFVVRESINATDDIPNKVDFISEAQKVLDDVVNTANELEERANNGEFNGKDGADGKDGENGKDAITDQTYDPESENAQSGKAVAEAISGINVTDNWELVEKITVEEEAVVSRKYSDRYKKIAVLVRSNVTKQPRFRLTGGEYFWEFNSYTADSYDVVSIIGEIVIPNAFQNVYAVVGNLGSNPTQARPITDRMFNAVSYFDGFKSATACKVGTTISVYGVKA